MGLWQSLKERRKHSRLVIDRPARFRVLGWSEDERDAPSFEARLVDLTEAGCGLAVAELKRGDFHLHRCLAEPEVHRLEIEVEIGASETWRAQARLVWINTAPSDKDRRFRLGVEFIGPTQPIDWRDRLKAGEPSGDDE